MCSSYFFTQPYSSERFLDQKDGPPHSFSPLHNILLRAFFFFSHNLFNQSTTAWHLAISNVFSFFLSFSITKCCSNLAQTHVHTCDWTCLVRSWMELLGHSTFPYNFYNYYYFSHPTSLLQKTYKNAWKTFKIIVCITGHSTPLIHMTSFFFPLPPGSQAVSREPLSPHCLPTPSFSHLVFRAQLSLNSPMLLCLIPSYHIDSFSLSN